jgi:hypothetical protein
MKWTLSIGIKCTFLERAPSMSLFSRTKDGEGGASGSTPRGCPEQGVGVDVFEKMYVLLRCAKIKVGAVVGLRFFAFDVSRKSRGEEGGGRRKKERR